MLSTLPTPWGVYSLRSSPFWQEPLSANDPIHPLSLFVGREDEFGRLTQTILGAGASPSRQAVAGAPGVGKTTLAKRVKAWAHERDYWALDSVVPILSDDTAERLFARVLAHVYSTILAYRPATADHVAMQAAQVLVRATREIVRGGGVSTPFGGISASQGITTTVPREIMIDGPRVMADLMSLVRTADGRGLLVQLNNLENLTEVEAANAGRILRDLRDPMMQHAGLHYLIIGTQEAVQTALQAPQLSSIISTVPLGPLPLNDVYELLEARYNHLKVEGAPYASVPVLPSVVVTLYDLFRGDVRGVLAALEDGVSPNIGQRGSAPLQADVVLRTATERYLTAFQARGDEARYQYLEKWGRRDPTALQTQADLMTLWDVSQPMVSTYLNELRADGYVVQLERRAGVGAGRPKTQYGLTGIARLIFAPET